MFSFFPVQNDSFLNAQDVFWNRVLIDLCSPTIREIQFLAVTFINLQLQDTLFCRVSSGAHGMSEGLD